MIVQEKGSTLLVVGVKFPYEVRHDETEQSSEFEFYPPGDFLVMVGDALWVILWQWDATQKSFFTPDAMLETLIDELLGTVHLRAEDHSWIQVQMGVHFSANEFKHG